MEKEDGETESGSEESPSETDEDDEDDSNSEEESSSEDETSSDEKPTKSPTLTTKNLKSKLSDSSSSSESNPSSDNDTDTDSDSDSTTSSSTSSDSSTASTNYPKSIKQLIPPGQGTTRTHLRNLRKARVKRLKALIAEGYLPEGSKLATLAIYESQTNGYNENTASFANAVQGNGMEDGVEDEMQVDNADTVGNVDKDDEMSLKKESEELSEINKSKTPSKKLDIAVISRFIKAGLSGNNTYDKEREEAKSRGKDKIVPTTKSTTFLPRIIKGKKGMSGMKEIKILDPEIKETENTRIHQSIQDNKNDEEKTGEKTFISDPLISDFYTQIKLANKNRQSKSNNRTQLSPSNPALSTPTPEHIPTSNELVPTSEHIPVRKPLIRAFECEPEWCGLIDINEIPENEEIDSMEIEPPELPFVDSYRQKRKKIAAAKGGRSRLSHGNGPGESSFDEFTPKKFTPTEIAFTTVNNSTFNNFTPIKTTTVTVTASSDINGAGKVIPSPV